MSNLSDFLHQQLWFIELTKHEQDLVIVNSYQKHVAAGAFVCHAGRNADHWYGVISGLVKASMTYQNGKTMTYAGVASGGWIGEGSVLKGTTRAYDVIALRESDVACVPRAVFLELYRRNLNFCHKLIDLLNNRLAQQMTLVELDRLAEGEVKVAKFIAMLTDSRFGGTDETVEITQGEMALLCNLSRPFTNKVLMKLTSLGLVKHTYGKLTVLDRDGLQRYGS